MMKKLIALLLATALLTGCTAGGVGDLMTGIQGGTVQLSADLDDGAEAATDFGLTLFRQTMEPGKNTLLSPLSVLYALSMTANGAAGDTLTQMEQVLGLDAETANQWLYSYSSQLPQGLTPANSIWFRDSGDLTVNADFLQVNGDYYGADIFKTPFDAAARDAINSWVNEKTDGMIPGIIDEIPEDVVMYLINALAFDAQWATAYSDHQVRSAAFTTEDGTERSVELMHSSEDRYLEDQNATGFIKYYADNTFAFVALLPKEGVSVADYISGLTGAELQKMLENPQQIEVHASIPKFETEYDVEMSGILGQMGMTDALDGSKADFSRLGSCTEGNIYIGRILHKTFISVAEQGTRAGAVTAIEMPAEGAIAPTDHKTVRLDRPFVYMLIDCENMVPFFIGAMMDVEGD